MNLGVIFLAFALMLAALAVVHGGWYWFLLWPVISFACVSAAYFSLGPRVFGKRADGTVSPLTNIVLLPYLAHTYLCWRLLRLLKTEPSYDELLPGVLIGRRLMSREFPTGIHTVVDLTCEFAEPSNIRTAPRYISFPILDAGAADAEQLLALLRAIDTTSGRIYIHCAEGHGRTGMVAASLLLVLNEVGNADDAIRMVQACRPAVRLKSVQQSAVRDVAVLLGNESGAAE